MYWAITLVAHELIDIYNFFAFAESLGDFDFIDHLLVDIVVVFAKFYGALRARFFLKFLDTF